MRYGILLLMLCLSAAVGESTNGTSSLQEFSKEVRLSYEKKDGDWIQKHTDTNGVPAEVLLAESQEMKELFACGKLEVTDVETFQFSDYTPKYPPPGEFRGRKLRFLGKPTHWIVVRGQCWTPPHFGWKHSIPAFQKDGHWSIAGVTYAD